MVMSLSFRSVIAAVAFAAWRPADADRKETRYNFGSAD
jgi:hypothetical protein